jgi:hypothetical protein
MLSVVVYVLLGLVLLSMELHITTISQPNSRVTSRGLKSKSIVQLITSIWEKKLLLGIGLLKGSCSIKFHLSLLSENKIRI